MSEIRFLRPATFEPPELALIYEALMQVSVPARRARDCASVLEKLEAATVPAADGDYRSGGLDGENKAAFQAAVNGATGRDAESQAG